MEALYREQGERLWRVILAWTGGREALADDITAETFARLIEHRAEVDHPVGWIYRTAFRFMLAEQRKERRSAVLESADPSIPPDLMGVVDAVQALSPSQRSAIVLRYEADLTLADISAAMGTSVSAVKVHLFRGRQRLRRTLGSEAMDDG